jgi:hypothetical protein
MLTLRLDAKRTIIALFVSALGVLAAEPTARAQEASDTVFLANGGRVRGTVMVESPTEVTVRLIDGTVRKLKPAEVSRVEYAGAKAPAPPPAAPVAAAAAPPPHLQTAPPGYVPVGQAPPGYAPAAPQPGPYAVPPQPGMLPAMDEGRPRKRGGRGLLISGAIVGGVGLVTMLGGTIAFTTAEDEGPYYGGIGMMAVGGTATLVGITLLMVGVASSGSSSSAATAFQTVRPYVGPRSAGVAFSF